MSGSTETPSTKRQRPPRRERQQRREVARQHEHGASLNGWLQDRRIAADKARASLREKALNAAKKAGTTVAALFGRRHPAAEPRTRGLRSPLTSVPGRHELMIQPTVVVEHQGPNHDQRRLMSRVVMPDTPGQSRAMRRKQAHRSMMPPGSTPYRSPDRAAKLQRAGRLRADLRRPGGDL